MHEFDLTLADKTMLKKDIKLSLLIGALLFIALVFIVGIIPGALTLLGKQYSAKFLNRGLFILGLLFIPFVAISWTNFLKFIDIKKGRKLRFESINYEIIKIKNSVFIDILDHQKRRIVICEELLPLLNLTKSLKLEITTIGKTLIFISNDENNLLDK